MFMELSIITLNVWGIPFVSRDRSIRIEAIANELAIGSYDIISLQEVWSEHDYQTIKTKIEHIYPYTHYFYSGVFGSGLCIFSKYPILSTLFHAWAVNGYFHRIQHADWFGGKGVGLCRILYNSKIINVYIAHLHAEYDDKSDEYKSHRIIQAFDTAQFIESTRNDAVLQILAGDLNTEPFDLSYKVLTKPSKLIDCCNDNIGTNECERNSYSSKKAIEKNPIGKRIDHILIRPDDNYKIEICRYRLPFAERIPGYSFSYSDHEAVSVNLKIIEKKFEVTKAEGEYCELTENNCGTDENDTISALQECISVCDSSLEKLKTDRIIYLSIAISLIFILIMTMDIIPPFGLGTVFIVMKFILCGIIIYVTFMGTLWNLMERHGILSGKLSMEIALKSTKDYFMK